MKKILCVLLCMLFLLPTFCAEAKKKNTGTLRMMAYNVSGIPLVGNFQGTVFTTTKERAKRIGTLLNNVQADFISTEEDFNGHKYLAEQMTNYPYRSLTSGGLAQGQGLNIFSPHPLYNVDRVKWRKEFGSLSGSMDALSNKGFVYALMELEKGIYVHVITVHMDAGYDPLSIRARRDNFKQLAEYINENLNDGRALIIQGDFNYKFKRRLTDDLFGNLLEPTGLLDVWAELENKGKYDPFDEDFNDMAPGDDLDRIIYRSGKDLKLEPISKTVPELNAKNGERYTDHDPMLTEFRYTRTGKKLSAPKTLTPAAETAEKNLGIKGVGWAVARVLQAFAGIWEIPYLIYQGIELLINGKLP